MAINIDGNGLITLGGTASTQGRVRLSEDTDNGTNYIELTAPASVASDRTITFPDATGTVVISGTTPSLNGITFPATQVASADVNTLDDYEEGTWTPVFEGTVNPSGLSLGNTDATYTKIGNSVRLSLNVTVSNIGTGGSGGMKVTGLPFTASSAMDFQPCTTESEGLLASVSNFVPIIEGNTTSILLYAGWNGTGGPTQLAWGTNAKNGMIFRLSVVYHAA
jgi:hypothetical protein